MKPVIVTDSTGKARAVIITSWVFYKDVAFVLNVLKSRKLAKLWFYGTVVEVKKVS